MYRRSRIYLNMCHLHKRRYKFKAIYVSSVSWYASTDQALRAAQPKGRPRAWLLCNTHTFAPDPISGAAAYMSKNDWPAMVRQDGIQCSRNGLWQPSDMSDGLLRRENPAYLMLQTYWNFDDLQNFEERTDVCVAVWHKWGISLPKIKGYVFQ